MEEEYIDLIIEIGYLDLFLNILYKASESNKSPDKFFEDHIRVNDPDSEDKFICSFYFSITEYATIIRNLTDYFDPDNEAYQTLEDSMLDNEDLLGAKQLRDNLKSYLKLFMTLVIEEAFSPQAYTHVDMSHRREL